MQYHFKIITAVIAIVLLNENFAFSQVEFVDVSHPVYNFLKRMQLKKIIPDYNSSNIPMSRKEVASYLSQIQNKISSQTNTDKKLLRDYEVEFEYDISNETKNQSSLFAKKGFSNFLN